MKINDFTPEELVEILTSLLKRDYQLDMKPGAKAKIFKYVENIKASETKDSPVNSRTILHLTQTVAHIAQLRIVRAGGAHSVINADVAHFKWDKRKGKVGFILS